MTHRVSWQTVFLLLLIGLIIIRLPELFIEPRFWADEGSRYFTYALHHTVIESLYHPQQGYYSLFNNVASLLAVYLVPLEHAPLVTTLLALLVQLIPFAIILWGNSPHWRTPTQKALACFIVLFIGQDSEIWLNTINSQFHLSLALFLLLLEDTKYTNKLRTILYGMLALFSGATGVVSCFLTPLFLLKAWHSKHRNDQIIAAILVLCCCIQLAAIASFILLESKRPPRFDSLTPYIVIWGIFSYSFISAILSPSRAEIVMTWLENTEESSIISFGLLLIMTLYLYYFSRTYSHLTKTYYIGSILIIATLSIVASIGGDPRPRYAYSTSCILMLMLSSQFKWPSCRFSKSKQLMSFSQIRPILSILFLLCGLSFGAYNYFFEYTNYSKNWPQWQKQVQRYHAGETQELMIHPPNWRVRMDPNSAALVWTQQK